MLALTAVCLTSRNWVTFELEDSDAEWDGSLFTVDEWGDSIEVANYGWDCIAIPSCDDDDSKTT